MSVALTLSSWAKRVKKPFPAIHLPSVALWATDRRKTPCRDPAGMGSRTKGDGAANWQWQAGPAPFGKIMMEDMKLAAPLASALAAKGYESLTAVQSAVLADGLEGRDLLVSAQTGSGKTVAFGLAIAAEVL